MSVDVWSIGVLAYELMMGKAPFEDPNKQKTKSLIINVKNHIFRRINRNLSTAKMFQNKLENSFS